MKRKNLIGAALLMSTLYVGLSTSAEETAAEKTQAAATQAVDGVKTGIEHVRDKTCELINGKLKCAYKKIKNKIKK